MDILNTHNFAIFLSAILLVKQMQKSLLLSEYRAVCAGSCWIKLQP